MDLLQACRWRLPMWCHIWWGIHIFFGIIMHGLRKFIIYQTCKRRWFGWYRSWHDLSHVYMDNLFYYIYLACVAYKEKSLTHGVAQTWGCGLPDSIIQRIRSQSQIKMLCMGWSRWPFSRKTQMYMASFCTRFMIQSQCTWYHWSLGQWSWYWRSGRCGTQE